MQVRGYEVRLEVLTADDGGGFFATVPDLPGCMSDGATPEEALANVADAIDTWIGHAEGQGWLTPPPRKRLT